MADRGEFVFFLERIAQSLHVPYLAFFFSITLTIEILRIAVDYLTVVVQMHLSVNDLVALWRSNWLIFLWPISMFLMYYSMEHLRNYTLHSVKQIQSRLTESPTSALTTVFRSRLQHLLPFCFLIICASVFAYRWLDDSNFTFFSATGGLLAMPSQEIPLKFIHSMFWISYNWIIGGYFSWICLGTVIVALDACKQLDIKRIDVFHHDRCGGLSAVGSLAMRTAVLYILSVSFMFPGWIVSLSYAPDFIGLALQVGALSGLVVIELAIFILPMIFFHSGMKDAKDKQLTRLEADVASYQDSLSKNRASEKDDRQLPNIIALQEIAQSMHEFPYNLGMLAKVITSASVPYLIAVAQTLIERALRSGS